MSKDWSVAQEEEDLYRRQLFARAKNGDGKAKRELQETYGVRLWSEHERAKLVYDNPKARRQRHQK